MQIRAKRASYASVFEVGLRIIDMVGLFLSMYVSELLVDNIMFGGAVYIVGAVWVIYVRLYNQHSIHLLPSGIRNRGLVVFIIALLLTAAVLFFFPYIQQKVAAVLLFLLLACFLLQQMVTNTVAAKLLPGRRPYRKHPGAPLLLALCHFLFVGMYYALFYGSQRLLAYSIPAGMGTAYAAVFLCTVALLLCQLYGEAASPEPETPGAGDAPAPDDLMGVHAYRVYNNMTTSAILAINLSITGFICYMRLLPYTGFIASVISLCVWLVFIAGITALCLFLLNRHYLKKYDRPAIFLFGLVLWGLATFGVLSGLYEIRLLYSIACAALLGASLACMLSIILLQGYEMKSVVELGVGHIDNGAYRRNTQVMVDWSMLISYLLVLAMLASASFIMDGKFDRLDAMLGIQGAMRLFMLLLPMAFVLISLVFVLRQPLDKQYAQKLRLYTLQTKAGVENPSLEKRLKKMLVSNYPKKLAVLLLKPVLRPFFPAKVYGQEHVDLSGGPVVFVCNHLELYGPIIAVLHSPFYFRPWVIHNMLDREIIAEYMHAGTENALKFIPPFLRNVVIRIAAPVVVWIMESTDPIPVYRGTVRGVIQTIQLSVEAMTCDDNILLFPEINYRQEGVGDFFTGFVQVARSYYKATGKCATFYPLYIDKKNRKMTYGKGIAFDPSGATGEEKERLVSYLQNTMNDLAARGTGGGIDPGNPGEHEGQRPHRLSKKQDR